MNNFPGLIGNDIEHILKYLYAVQNIAAYKNDVMDYMTPYGLDTRRQEAHAAMAQNVIIPLLDNYDDADVYTRTKDITDNLDKVWKIYDSSPFDILDDECIPDLAYYLHKLLYSAECKNYLEGKSKFLRDIHF